MVAVAILVTRFAKVGFSAQGPGSAEAEVCDWAACAGHTLPDTPEHRPGECRPFRAIVNPGLQVIHEAVDDAVGLIFCHVGQGRVEGRRLPATCDPDRPG